MTHNRYFITMTSDAEGTRYRTSTGSWTRDITQAMLWGNLKFAEGKAVKLRKAYLDWVCKYGSNLVIDQDEVEVIEVKAVEVKLI